MVGGGGSGVDGGGGGVESGNGGDNGLGGDGRSVCVCDGRDNWELVSSWPRFLEFL